MTNYAVNLESGSVPRGQRGVVLVIALIVLVAMTLAGIALVRSVDTANVIAGNLAFKQSTVQASDRGIQVAMTWLDAHNTGGGLNSSIASAGYAAIPPATEPDWSTDAAWANAVIAPDAAGNDTDAAGNTVYYLIHRMCTQADAAYNGDNGGVANQCATSYTSGGGSDGNGMGIGQFIPDSPPKIYYRITSRVVGPRNTYSVVQAMVKAPT